MKSKLVASQLLVDYCHYRDAGETKDQALIYAFIGNTNPGDFRKKLWDVLIGTPLPKDLDNQI